MTLKNIIPWIISLVLAALLLLATCNRKSDTTTPPPGPDVKSIADSITKALDTVTALRQWVMDSAASVNDIQAEYIKTVEGKQKDAEASAQFWAMKYRLSKRDTAQPAVIFESCDSLANVAQRLTGINYTLRDEQAKRDANYQYQLRVADTLRGEMDVAYNSVVDLVVSSDEAFSAYRKATAPRASLYIGITGGTNFTQSSAGPSLMYRGRGGRTQIMGAYEVGNTQPVYRAGIYKRISLRKK